MRCLPTCPGTAAGLQQHPLKLELARHGADKQRPILVGAERQRVAAGRRVAGGHVTHLLLPGSIDIDVEKTPGNTYFPAQVQHPVEKSLESGGQRSGTRRPGSG